MHCVTSLSQWWQNYMNCTLNCFRTPTLFFQIWPPSDYWLYADSKECSRKRDLAPIKKWYQKLRHILSPKTNCSTKKHWLVREALESVYHPRRRLLMNKVEFRLKIVILLVGPGLIEWCVNIDVLELTAKILYTNW